MYIINEIDLNNATALCHKIVESLPQYFNRPGMNESYAPGMYTRINLAIKVQDDYEGLLGLEYPYSENAHIYWMGIMPDFHRKGMGAMLVQKACEVAKLNGAQTITVETLAPLEQDADYLKTYRFFKACGFTPLFDMQATNYQFMMVHMVKYLE